jgi:16S rRNA G966 N2-methylase RsmD
MRPDIENWSFADSSISETRWGTHGYHRYPAKFIPQLVEKILIEFASPKARIADPFLGSGTTGIEAIRRGHSFYGSDINPVACLISRAKCVPISPAILDSLWLELAKQLDSFVSIGRRELTPQERESIINIDISRATGTERWKYWFPEAYRNVLGNILETIGKTDDPVIREFLLCGFSNILKPCSIWLSGSTKPQKDLEKQLADPVKEFSSQIRDMIKRNRVYWDFLVSKGIQPQTVAEKLVIEEYDARCLNTNHGEFDLIITSPPYATCYEYSEIHQLTQLWLERSGFLPTTTEKSQWIGSRRSTVADDSNELSETFVIVNAALEKLTQVAQEHKYPSSILSEVRALSRYFSDMHQSIRAMATVVPRNKKIVLVIGDSRRRNVDIPTTDALIQIAESEGFILEKKISRRIPTTALVGTRDATTGRFSSTKSDVVAYSEENIIILKRT